MDFPKYIEIENSYRDKFIARFLEEFPDLKNEKYVIQEKIHGTNVRLHFEDGNMYIGSRNTEIPEGQDHMGLREALKTIEPVIRQMKRYSKEREPITLFGELFGGNIQKQIKYGEKRILFFDAKLETMLCYESFLELMESFEIENYIVPVLGTTNNLEAALSWPCEFTSTLCSDQAEGIVIKPYNGNIYIGEDIFYLKKKPEKFAEKTPKEKVERKESPLVPYINENRMQSVFSKEGQITSKTDIPKYIRLISADAIKDFEKDNPDIQLTEEDKKVGGLISKLLLNEL